MLTLFVRVTSMYAGEGMDNHHFTEVHDIYVKDLKCKKVNVAALVLQGTEEKPIYNVTFDNVDVDKAGIGLGFSNTKTIGVSNCNWEVMLVRWNDRVKGKQETVFGQAGGGFFIPQLNKCFYRWFYK